MKFKNLFYATFIFLMFPLIVSAITFDYTITVPTNNTVLTDRFVNYTYNYEVTVSNSTLLGGGMNTSVWLNGTEAFTPVNLTNATYFNWTQNLADGDYEWYVNVTNGTETNKSATRYFTVSEPAPTDYTITLLAPAEYTTLTSTAVNFSYVASALDNINSTDFIECSVYNKSVRAHNYSVLYTLNTTNGSFFNYTATVPEGRLYWYVNCTNTFQSGKTFESTDMRIFDTDEDYYTLTFGIAERINMTLDKGGIDIFGNFTGNQIYGEMFYHNHTGTEVEFVTQDVFYPLFFTNATYLNGFTFNGGWNVSSNLTAQVSGLYKADWMAIGSGENNDVYSTTILINNVYQPSCAHHLKLTAGGDETTQTGSCFIKLSVGDHVTLATENIGGDGDGLYFGGNINIVRIGS